jgi:hypothetical protein
MTMRSPILAMLWETWRLTRVEVAWRLAIGIVGGMAALAAVSGQPEGLKDFSAAIALTLIVLPHFVGWLSMAKVNGGRPGFPLYLLYTRPLRTPVLVAVPMAYLTVLPSAIYLVSALLLRVTSGYAFPLLPVAAWIAALNLANLAANWWTRNRLVVLLGNLTVGVANVTLAMNRLTAEEIPGADWPPNRWPAIFDLPLTYYTLMALIGLAAVGVAVTGVARQRHGGIPAAIPWAAGLNGYPDWIRNLFRFPCPTSSATRAQVWFDLKSSGLAVLTIGVVLAMVNPLLFAVGGLLEFARPVVGMFSLFSVLVVLVFGGNAFGIRRQGRLGASVFEATQPYGTARLAGLKVLVRSVCVLAALVAVGVSVWASMSFIAVGQGGSPLRGYEPLRSWQRAIESALGALTAEQQVALAVVAFIGVAVMVASFAAWVALAARYPRRVGHVGWLLLLHGLVLVPLVLTGYRGVGSVVLWEFLLDALVWITRWIDAPAIVLATVYVSWRAFAERLLTLRSACGAVLVSAAFGAAWLTMLRAAGVQLAAMPATDAFWMLSPALLPLTASVLAPWSLSRVRHT